MGGPPFPNQPDRIAFRNIDRDATNLYLEFNVLTDYVNLVTPEPGTNCGSGSGPTDCSEGPAGYYGRNVEGVTEAPANWTQAIPDSLHMTSVPSWWCQEACAFDQTGIGAFGDDSSTQMCKLPAQIRYEGGRCTPLTPGLPVAPFPPILLDP